MSDPLPEIHGIPLGRIVPGKHNPRKRLDEGSLQELAESIRAVGVLQPILVRQLHAAPPAYEIVAGERRWHAAKLAGLSEVPALVRQLSDVECLTIAVTENEQRQDVSPLERAEGYRRLVEDHGVGVEDLAARVLTCVEHLRAAVDVARCAFCGERYRKDQSDAIRAHMLRCEKHPIHHAAAKVLAVVDLLRRIVGEPEPCRLDHHGFCQEHRFRPPCPYPEAAALLAQFPAPKEE